MPTSGLTRQTPWSQALCFALAASCAVVCGSSGALAGQETTRGGPLVSVTPRGGLAVHADAVPLVQVLRAIQARRDMEVRLDPSVADRPVTVAFDEVVPADAVRGALVSADVDFVLAEGPAGSVFRVVIGEARSAVPLAAGPAQPSTPAFPGQEPRVPATEPPSVGESKEDPATALQADAPRQRAEGEVTGAEILQLITRPSGAPTSGWIELPFLDPSGQPYRVYRPPGPRTQITLPFPDAEGKPIVLPMPTPAPGATPTLPVPAPPGSGSGAAGTPGATKPAGRPPGPPR